MYLCDYLGADNILINRIRELRGVGDVFEVKSTALRDMAAYMKNPELTGPNLYTTWMKTSAEGSSPDMFLTEISRIAD